MSIVTVPSIPALADNFKKAIGKWTDAYGKQFPAATKKPVPVPPAEVPSFLLKDYMNGRSS